MRQFFIFILLAASATLQAQVFVSPSGSNTGDGSFEHPFATIEKAQQAARLAEHPVTIYLREGEYRLNSTLLFTAEDNL
ncbi:MAG: hypothetical protein LBR84_08660, partial [Tannerella sp.]|nr:hypothetical protein [Tannerella sp.]